MHLRSPKSLLLLDLINHDQKFLLQFHQNILQVYMVHQRPKTLHVLEYQTLEVLEYLVNEHNQLYPRKEIWFFYRKSIIVNLENPSCLKLSSKIILIQTLCPSYLANANVSLIYPLSTKGRPLVAFLPLFKKYVQIRK